MEHEYEILLSRTARRRLAEQLPEAAAVSCIEFIYGPLATNPRLVGTPLHAPFDGLWRARRGEYRVRYRIDEDARAVEVISIDHRRDAYRS